MIVQVPSQNNDFGDIKEQALSKMLEQSASFTTTPSAAEVFEDDLVDNNNTVKFTTTFLQDDSLRFILVPLAVLLGIITLSALVYLMARQRRINRSGLHIDNYTTHKTDNYRRFAGAEECDEIDDDPTECLLNGKLQINNRYENYQSAQILRISKSKSELYT